MQEFFKTEKFDDNTKSNKCAFSSIRLLVFQRDTYCNRQKSKKQKRSFYVIDFQYASIIIYCSIVSIVFLFHAILLFIYFIILIIFQQKMKKISEVMDALPDSIRGKLPLPPPFRKLPQDVQQKLHAIQIEHGLTMEQRFKKFRQIIESLPPEQKKLLPPPPQARRSGSAPK